ncbi:hypothetical protein HanPI659440_Chr15g0595161 [Helianthus annuus]|nr:hypothetical protein HanPI659440_Chr15g0595161 [Helianthus annuus]
MLRKKMKKARSLKFEKGSRDELQSWSKFRLFVSSLLSSHSFKKKKKSQ